MASEIAVSVYLAAGIGAALYVGSTFDPLTFAGDDFDPGVGQPGHVAQEFSYCRGALTGIDCVCFAGKAGYVLAHDAPTIRGATNADRRELARGQAVSSC